MTDETRTAGGVPVVKAEPVGSPREPMILRGSWVSRVSKRGDYGVLETSTGLGLMADRDAALKLCMALGIEVRR